jgi:hypothetical protein
VEKYYVEYSQIQNAIHIDIMENIQRFNTEAIRRKLDCDYLIIAGPMSLEEAFLYDPKLGGL